MKWSLCLLFCVTVLVLIVFKRYDGFGMSPGTPVQLSSTQVTTKEDIYYWKNVYSKIVRKEMYNLTESDLH